MSFGGMKCNRNLLAIKLNVYSGRIEAWRFTTVPTYKRRVWKYASSAHSFTLIARNFGMWFKCAVILSGPKTEHSRHSNWGQHEPVRLAMQVETVQAQATDWFKTRAAILN